MSNKISVVNKFLIVVAGPTGVGKTAVSIMLAKEFNAEIFSADSRQMYKEMDIGTAKPSLEELNLVPHHFINHIGIHQPYSAGQFQTEIRTALNKYFDDHQIGIMTGGTGLYIRALLDGLDDFPDIPESVKEHYDSKLKENGIQSLQLELSAKDPVYYETVDQDNARRLIRSLCVISVSGKPYTSFLSPIKVNPLPFETIPILLDLPRKELYETINKRVDSMIDNGLIDEAKHLFPHRHLQALQTVGYRELFDFFEGNISMTDAIALIKQNTRRYAKRQLTWFRKYGNWHVADPHKYSDIRDYVISKITG
ncbi:MAG: tRNA (adenosine(37)-N6)-dimethylallyltransferase MiaA [Saprospiraceae bacterium]|nr:tRNA (adenosine(37)-N6)-dimethylallyltransferase MiaA [Saprospiraceae bacterium]